MKEGSRIIISTILVIIGVISAIFAGLSGVSESVDQAEGTVIDFGDREVIWTDADPQEYDTTLDLLTYAVESNGLDLKLAEDGSIASLNGIVSDNERWDLWVIYSGDDTWVKLDAPYDQDPSEFTITSWSYCGQDEYPTVAVDYSGKSFYGHSQKYRVVSLSPTVTEILSSVKAQNIIVGVDSYSDHPQSVVNGVADGSISIVGTYTSPSFELIMGTNPDMVICDGSQRSHVQMADRLRSVGVDAIVTYPGEDVGKIMDNIYMVGTSIGYGLAAKSVLSELDYVLDELEEITAGASTPRVMVSLEPDISPWVSGNGTYMDGILAQMGAENVFSDWYGWVHITSDRIPYENPELIIVITTEYEATDDEYEYLYSHLSAQWQQTDAWKNGNVYVICESAADLVQRSGPRLAQTAELISMIVHPECFDTELPKIIGDDYIGYLQLSEGLDYDN